MNQPAKVPPKTNAIALLQDKHTIAQITRALPKHFSADRMLRIALTELRKNPKLMDCDPFSFLGAVIQCAQLGLEPGSGLGHAYLVPYGKECTFIPGYKGLADLSRRSGQVGPIYSDLVMEGDKFFYGIKRGIPDLEWEPLADDRDPNNMLAVFATATFKSGEAQFAVMRKIEVDRIRDGLRYKSDIWRVHYGEMAKKTAVRRLCKLLPQSPELVRIQELDDAANDGSQLRMNLQPLVDVGLVADDYDPEPEKAAPIETPKDKEKKAQNHAATLAEFDAAYAGAKSRGLSLGDALKILGMEAEKVRKRPTDEIEAATDILNAYGVQG